MRICNICGRNIRKKKGKIRCICSDVCKKSRYTFQHQQKICEKEFMVTQQIKDNFCIGRIYMYGISPRCKFIDSNGLFCRNFSPRSYMEEIYEARCYIHENKQQKLQPFLQKIIYDAPAIPWDIANLIISYLN